jgi:hypothetical protein
MISGRTKELAMEDRGSKDGAVLAHIEKLVAEEHKLVDRGELDDAGRGEEVHRMR